jgi:hypothetical protein
MVEQEVARLHESAFGMMKEILERDELVEAMRKCIGKYTRNVDIEFSGIDQVKAASLNEAFREHRGAAYMLWNVCIELLRTHQVEKSSQVSPELIEDQIYQAYSRSGASSY